MLQERMQIESHTKPRLQARLKGDRRRPASANCGCFHPFVHCADAVNPAKCPKRSIAVGVALLARLIFRYGPQIPRLRAQARIVLGVEPRVKSFIARFAVNAAVAAVARANEGKRGKPHGLWSAARRGAVLLGMGDNIAVRIAVVVKAQRGAWSRAGGKQRRAYSAGRGVTAQAALIARLPMRRLALKHGALGEAYGFH